MNYKKRNIIGIISFFIIILFMLNFNYFLEIINYKILGVKFTGIKGDKLFFSELDDRELTKDEFVNYIINNLEKIGYERFKNVDFSIYTRNIEGEDNFIESFKITVTDNFDKTLYKNLGIIPMNQELLFKFVLNIKDKTYSSNIFLLKIVDELYKNQKKIILNLNDYIDGGTNISVSVPKYLKLNDNVKINVEANHNDLIVTGLNAKYNEEDNIIVINNLIPLKLYSNIRITTKNSDEINISLNINKININPKNELQDYLSKVYLKSLNRYPYESEYFDYLEKLSNHKILFNDFLDNIISSDEFNTVNNTPKKVVDSIYFLVNKKQIDSRLSTIILDEFNDMLLNENLFNQTKFDILNKFLYDDETLKYVKNELNLLVK